MVRQILINSGTLIGQYAVASLTPLILIPHIVRTLGVETYGHLAVAVAWASLGSVVIQYAFQLTGPKRVAELGAGESSGTVFAEITVARVMLLGGALPLLAALAATLVPMATAIHLLVIGALPLAAALNASWYLLVRDKVLVLSSLAICGSVMALAIGFVLVRGAERTDEWAAAAALIAAPLFTGAATLLAAWLLARKAGISLASARPVHALREGFPLFASQFVAAAYGTAGPIVVGHLANLSEAGAYSAVERIVNALAGGCLLFHTAAYPRLAAAYTQKTPVYWQLLGFVLFAYVGTAVFIAAIAWAFRDAVLRVLFRGAVDGEALLAFALVWLVLAVFGPVLTGYLTVSGRGREVVHITLKVLALAAIIGVPGVLIFGAAGWMAALVLSQVVVVTAIFRCWRRESKRSGESDFSPERVDASKIEDSMRQDSRARHGPTPEV